MAAVKKDWRTARLSARGRALCEYAVKLTERPWDMEARDLEPLRSLGLTDVEIHDAAQVAAYFNYINRVADGLGCDLEPEMPPRREA